MKHILFIISLSTLLVACSNNNDTETTVNTEKPNIIDTQEERKFEVDKYSALLYADSLNINVKSNPIALSLLSAYEQYIQYHSFKSDSKDIQFLAGDLARNLDKPHVAIKHFNGLLERAPEHEKAGMALFYKALIIGDDLHEDELAKKTYQEFIDNYPDHPFVESAKQSILLQGKTNEEIIAGFEKNS